MFFLRKLCVCDCRLDQPGHKVVRDITTLIQGVHENVLSKLSEVAVVAGVYCGKC